jgi:hypothetical protein
MPCGAVLQERAHEEKVTSRFVEKILNGPVSRFLLADVPAAAGRKAEAVTAAERAVKLAHPNEPRPEQALEALKK